MMKVVAGDKMLPVLGIHSEYIYCEGSTRPCLTFDLSGEGISQEQVEALVSNPISIFDENGDLMGVQENFNRVASFQLTLVQVQDAEVTIQALRQQILDLQQSIDSKVEAGKEELRRQLADQAVQKSAEIEREVTQEKNRSAEALSALKLAHRRELEDSLKSLEMELEETILSHRGDSNPKLEAAWDPNERYVTGDQVTGYIALRFSRGKKPEENLGTYWSPKSDVKTPVDWESIPNRSTIERLTLVTCDGKTWVCVAPHLKSLVFRPKVGSTKWEEVET